MLTFLLDTKLGHLLIGLVCMALVGAGMYWKGHNRGWDSATAHYQAVVSACMNANTTEAQVIEQLKAANQVIANQARANEAKAAAAVAKTEADAKTNAQALASAQARLHEIERTHGDAHAAAVTPLPDAVYRAICADGVCEPPNR